MHQSYPFCRNDAAAIGERLPRQIVGTQGTPGSRGGSHGRKQSITELAQEYEVSRKFIYQQAHKAEQALNEAFSTPEANDDKVLFYLPATKGWLRAC